MKISLRKAHALQSEIESVISGLVMNSDATIDQFSGDIADTLNKARIEFLEKFDERNRLTTILYIIRSLVSEASNSVKINEYLSKVAATDRLIQYYNLVSLSKPNDFTVEKLTEKLAYVVEKSKTSTSYMPTDIRVNVFDKQQIDEFKIQLSELKKEKREYQDTLLELNMSTQIELSNQIVDVLKKHHLL